MWAELPRNDERWLVRRFAVSIVTVVVAAGVWLAIAAVIDSQTLAAMDLVGAPVLLLFALTFSISQWWRAGRQLEQSASERTSHRRKPVLGFGWWLRVMTSIGLPVGVVGIATQSGVLRLAGIVLVVASLVDGGLVLPWQRRRTAREK